MNYLKLTKTGSKDKYGCYVLELKYFKNDNLVGKIECCSGIASAQRFRKGVDSRAGSMEPLPEGCWYINDIIWAGGRDNYEGAIFQSGIGPVTIPLNYLGPYLTERSAIEIHVDWNWQIAPGTSGCVGIYNARDMAALIRWLRDTNPRQLFVDWELGSCPSPDSFSRSYLIEETEN